MFKWFKKMLGTDTADTVSTTVAVVAPVAVAVAESGKVSVEPKPKRSRAKKADTQAPSEPVTAKRTARATPAKQTKKSQ